MQALATVALMASLMGAGSPGGDPVLAEARAHVEAARKAFVARKFSVALQEFQAAQRLKPAPVLWYNIGKCYEKLNTEVPSALRAYRTYLIEAPGTSDRKEVEKAIVRMEAKLRARGVQQLMVLAQPAGATASIPGKGSLPVPATWELRPGTYTVTVSATGYQTSSQPVTVTAKKSAKVEVALTPTGSPQAPPTPPTSVATSEANPPPPVESKPPPKTADQGTVTVAVRPSAPPAAGRPGSDAPLAPPRGQTELGSVLAQPRQPLPLTPPPPASGRLWTWVAGGVSVVGVGAGVGFGLNASSASSELLNGNLHTEAEATALYSRARSSALYANIGYGAAAAAGAAAVVLFLLEGQPSSASASAAPAAGGAPVVLSF